jgi:hypothetical protein
MEALKKAFEELAARGQRVEDQHLRRAVLLHKIELEICGERWQEEKTFEVGFISNPRAGLEVTTVKFTVPARVPDSTTGNWGRHSLHSLLHLKVEHVSGPALSGSSDAPTLCDLIGLRYHQARTQAHRGKVLLLLQERLGARPKRICAVDPLLSMEDPEQQVQVWKEAMLRAGDTPVTRELVSLLMDEAQVSMFGCDTSGPVTPGADRLAQHPTGLPAAASARSLTTRMCPPGSLLCCRPQLKEHEQEEEAQQANGAPASRRRVSERSKRARSAALEVGFTCCSCISAQLQCLFCFTACLVSVSATGGRR